MSSTREINLIISTLTSERQGLLGKEVVKNYETNVFI